MADRIEDKLGSDLKGTVAKRGFRQLPAACVVRERQRAGLFAEPSPARRIMLEETERFHASLSEIRDGREDLSRQDA